MARQGTESNQGRACCVAGEKKKLCERSTGVHPITGGDQRAEERPLVILQKSVSLLKKGEGAHRPASKKKSAEMFVLESSAGRRSLPGARLEIPEKGGAEKRGKKRPLVEEARLARVDFQTGQATAPSTGGNRGGVRVYKKKKGLAILGLTERYLHKRLRADGGEKPGVPHTYTPIAIAEDSSATEKRRASVEKRGGEEKGSRRTLAVGSGEREDLYNPLPGGEKTAVGG